MFRTARTARTAKTATAMTALLVAATGTALTGAHHTPSAAASSQQSRLDSTELTAEATVAKAGGHLFTGNGKIEVGGRSVNVSCSGEPAPHRPVVVLMAGMGDGLDNLSGIQKTLSATGKVCSYDRLGEGLSDAPAGPQTMDSSGKVLTAVLDRVAGHRPVVLVGHSLGGLIAARYAPEHPDRVKGLVLLDATPSTMAADLTRIVPPSATGPGADARDGYLAVSQGQNPEMLSFADAPVRSAGDTPVEIVRHGVPYLAQSIPTYGPALEHAWAKGERAWLALSTRSSLSVAAKSDHYIYVGQPELVDRAVRRVASQASGRS
ncbi:alpha/beta fold hydrolase [Streptomyces sp. NPDC090083]|uniref:alpha/beta fold hydrolase n=1 Tax=Streptomyces sp. NPDC090083 TaxID=3365941 RepID=UPI00381BD205